MMKSWGLISVVFFSLWLSLNAQSDTLDYPRVLDQLLADYYPDVAPDEFLSISRQPAGYFVGIQSGESTFPMRQYPYRLTGETEFKTLPFRKRDKADLMPHYASEMVGVWRSVQFERHLYFGYPGFTTQTIATLSNKKNRRAEETQQLARANAEHAMNLLNNQYGTSDPELRFKLDESTYEYLSQSQLEEYLRYQLSAIKLYGQLPFDFATPVGNAPTKQANEWMTAYLALLQYSPQEVADEFIAQMPDTYGDHLKFAAKMMLESVPVNGLLITEGDNDTYPLIYLQLKEGLRTDVLVINRHLLAIPRYVKALRLGKQIGGELELSTSDRSIRAWATRNYMPGDRYELYRAPEALKALGELPDLASESVMPFLPFGGIQLSARVDGPIFRPEARPLRSADLVVMDLIATNFKDKRQVAIATTVNQDYFAYANSWQQVGIVYNLGDEKPAYKIDLEGTVAWSALLFLRTPITRMGKASEFLLDRIEKVIVEAATSVRMAGQRDLALRLINRYLSHLDYKEIFGRRASLPLLRQLSLLNYDPVTITAYVSYLRQEMLKVPYKQMSRGAINDLDELTYYLSNGRFPADFE
jgi:hypothetical protein